MTEPGFVFEVRHRSIDPPAPANEEVLERAVAKIILLGGQVGVSTDQMICLLNSGLTVSELLEYLVNRAGSSA